MGSTKKNNGITRYLVNLKQEQFHGENSAMRDKPTRDVRCLRIFKCITRKYLTLQMKVKVTQYNIHNDPIRWQISTSIKVILEHFSLALTVFEIFIFKKSLP